MPRTTTADRRTTTSDSDCFGMCAYLERNAAGSRNEVHLTIADRNLRTSSTTILNLRSARALWQYLGEFLVEREEDEQF